MAEKRVLKSLFVLLYLFFSASGGMALETDTHELLNTYIAENQLGGFSLGNFLDNQVGFKDGIEEMIGSLKVRQWLARGGRYEDKPLGGLPYLRSRNHFHNPLLPWDQAGFTDSGSFCDWGHCPVSAILWAQGPQNSDLLLGVDLNPGGDWSWPKVREHFFIALTSTTREARDTNFANTFRGLGQVMHLIEDMSVPEHTRNDFHLGFYLGDLGLDYEGWVKKYGVVDSESISPRYAPEGNHFFAGNINGIASFFDTDQYVGNNPEVTWSNTAGLAEYSNANFFSPDTIFSPEFPYPSISNTHVEARQVPGDDGKLDNVYYLFVDGQDHVLANALMASESYFADNPLLFSKPDNWKFNLDKNVYKDYARILLPRAIGYSAGLMKYFFRGIMEVQAVSGGSSFRGITVNVKNITANGDDMLGGDVSLVVRYREMQEVVGSDGVRTLSFPSEEYRYRVVNWPYPIAIPKDNPVQLAFNLSADPLPLHITDVNLQLVYKGTLGNESGAVAVGSVSLASIGSDIGISLPATGIYAKATDNVFNTLALTAKTEISGLNWGDGIIELVLKYRKATSDPFASMPVDTEPQNANSYVIRVAEKNGVNTLPSGQAVALQFDLPTAPLPLYATDVYLFLSYRRAGNPQSNPMAVGYHDISEPTPVDLFSNTDRICIGGSWYSIETQGGIDNAIAAADEYGNQNHIADDSDVFPHYFTDIFTEISSSSDPALASITRYDFFEAGPMPPNTLLRIGYILIDYSFNYSFLETWNKMPQFAQYDYWTTSRPVVIFPGTAVKNQTAPDGTQYYPSMYTIRGVKMWWGAGLIYDNPYYPTSSSCNWNTIP